MAKRLSINADVGEGVSDEYRIFPYLDACNIACGGHTGDEVSMTGTVRLALNHGVSIGAHPSYPDRENFGRISQSYDAERLKESIVAQIDSLQVIVEENDASIRHIKPHGALYNDMARDASLMVIFLDAIVRWKEASLILPYGASTAQIAVKCGFEVRYEAFLDRRYEDDYSLTSRKISGALITDPVSALAQANMMMEDKVITTKGSILDMNADTYCIHGDNPACLAILEEIHTA